MKKFLATVLGIAMLVSCSALFAGCGGKVYIKGNFSQEATDEEVAELKSQIRSSDGTNLITLGDTSSEDWVYNLREVDTTSLKMDLAMNVLGQSIQTKTTMSIKTDYIYGLTNTDSTLALTGNGKIKGDMTIKMSSGGESATVSSSVNFNGYNEGNTLYLNGSIKASAANETINYSGKYKTSLSEVTDDLAISSFASVNAVASDIDSAIGDLVTMFDTEGCVVYIDSSSSEVKVKVEMDAEAFIETIGLDEWAEGLDVPQEGIKVSRAAFYFSFSKETNLFTGYGVDAKISINYSEGVNSLQANFTINQWLLFTTDTVEVPADLTGYEDLSI